MTVSSATTIGTAEERVEGLQQRFAGELESVSVSGLGRIHNDEGSPIGVSIEVRVDPVERENATAIATSVGFDVVEVDSIRSLDASRPGRATYTADEVRLTYGLFI